MLSGLYQHGCAALLLLLMVSGPAPAFAADEDVERALVAVRASAKSGDVVAQFSLGGMLYYAGSDLGEAIDWIRKAAGQRYAPAEFHLGQLYDFGFGVVADDREALAWYRKAAEHGSAAAQRQLGEFFRRGRGVGADPAEAARWYRSAAERDDLQAQYQLGQMYLTGTGVSRDYVSAYVWFSAAASQTPLVDNYKALIELRNIAGARMAPEEELAAARRAAEWKPMTDSQP
jgi:uncharacterized protein